MKTVQNSYKQICLCIFMWEDNRGCIFSLEETFITMSYGLSHQTWQLMLKCLDAGFIQMCCFLLHDTLINTLVVWITCRLLWCFYQLFELLFWRHPFTAEDLLMSKWCNAKFLQICSNEETNSHLGWPESGYIFSKFSFFAWTISLTALMLKYACNLITLCTGSL